MRLPVIWWKFKLQRLFSYLTSTRVWFKWYSRGTTRLKAQRYKLQCHGVSIFYILLSQLYWELKIAYTFHIIHVEKSLLYMQNYLHRRRGFWEFHNIFPSQKAVRNSELLLLLLTDVLHASFHVLMYNAIINTNAALLCSKKSSKTSSDSK